jgi:hypothetical protein
MIGDFIGNVIFYRKGENVYTLLNMLVDKGLGAGGLLLSLTLYLGPCLPTMTGRSSKSCQ